MLIPTNLSKLLCRQLYEPNVFFGDSLSTRFLASKLPQNSPDVVSDTCIDNHNHTTSSGTASAGTSASASTSVRALLLAAGGDILAERYEKLFLENGFVDQRSLAGLNDERLQLLGITNVGDRLRIAAQIETTMMTSSYVLVCCG